MLLIDLSFDFLLAYILNLMALKGWGRGPVYGHSLKKPTSERAPFPVREKGTWGLLIPQLSRIIYLNFLMDPLDNRRGKN
jgi:hypothetical protein